jgi:hypothetical protein
MCDGLNYLPEPKDWLIFFFGVLSTVLWTIILYQFRPRLNITKVEPCKVNKKNGLAITVENQGKYFAAINLRIEACFIDGDSYHVVLDMIDFLILGHL